jgi:phosphate/sulfate permease
MLILVFLVEVTCFLGYSNGANDNFNDISSRFGTPVSTTHVSVGSIFGIGTITSRANKRVVGEILLSWVLTLPIAATIAGVAYWALT